MTQINLNGEKVVETEKVLVLKEDGSFTLPEHWQGKDKVSVVMPYKKEVYNGKSISTFMRQPKKEKPYIDDGYVEFVPFGQKTGERYKIVNAKGEQVFWVKR